MSNSSSEDEPKTLETNSTTDYEKERESRIAANNARLNSLGLIALSKSLIPKPVNRVKTRSSTPKSKRDVHKNDDNDEYHPDFDGVVDVGSSEDDDDFEDEVETEKISTRPHRIGLRYNKVKNLNSKSGKTVSTSKPTDTPVVLALKQVKNMKLKSGKKVSTSNPTDIPVFMDEDEALKQAIALSLKDPEDINGGSSQKLNSQTASVKEDNSNTQRKRKLFTSRVQMTDDDLVIHFCQIDQAGKGGITLRDVARMAATHDFPWTEEELSDMIHCFDSDRDGKLTLDDLRNIAQRCNMLPAQEQS